MEVTVFCSETGGEAEGKLKFVCCKAWVGWWEGWRAGSSGDIFRGFDCIREKGTGPRREPEATETTYQHVEHHAV